MKRKELKNLAKKIAKYELICQTSDDAQEVAAAEDEIYRLSGCVHDLSDIETIDELVQDILAKENF